MMPLNSQPLENTVAERGKTVPGDPSNHENWSGEDKLSVVIETAALNDQELSESCRKTEKELKRKEKAFAEADVLLVFKKKAQAIWVDGGQG